MTKRLFFVLLFLCSGAYAQTAYYFGIAVDMTHHTSYITGIFPAPAGSGEACAAAFEKEIVKSYGAIDNRAYGFTNAYGCNTYDSMNVAQSSWNDARTMGQSTGQSMVSVDWTYQPAGKIGQVLDEEPLIASHATGWGATQSSALEVARINAQVGYTSIKYWDPPTCSAIGGNSWTCTQGFRADYNGVPITRIMQGKFSSGLGKTKAQALAEAEKFAETTWGTSILRWHVTSCVDQPSRDPRWGCTLALTINPDGPHHK